MKLGRLILFAILSFAITGVLNGADDDDRDYFTGTVVETTKDHLKVSKMVPGKSEERIFKITAQTKVEGRIRAKVRVNVTFISSPDGYTATLVIVRAEPTKPKGK